MSSWSRGLFSTTELQQLSLLTKRYFKVWLIDFEASTELKRLLIASKIIWSHIFSLSGSIRQSTWSFYDDIFVREIIISSNLNLKLCWRSSSFKSLFEGNDKNGNVGRSWVWIPLPEKIFIRCKENIRWLCLSRMKDRLLCTRRTLFSLV